MRTLLATLAVLWTLLLAAIAVELYRIDQSVAWMGAPTRSVTSSLSDLAAAGKNESRQQRIERKALEIQKLRDNFEEALEAGQLATRTDKSATAQKPPQR